MDSLYIYSYILEVPGHSSEKSAKCDFEYGHLGPCHHTSDPEMCNNVSGWIYKMTNDDFSQRERESLFFSNSSCVVLHLFPTNHHTGGDLSSLLFHCNPRGLSVCYYLFFSSPASSLPSHFLSLMILQYVSLVVFFFFFFPGSHFMISYLGVK